MTRFSFGALGALARAAIVVATALVAGCGSGAVSAPPSTAPGGPITVTPDTATLYSDEPTTFLVTGGNGNYLVLSSDQTALPVAGPFTGNSLTLVASQVIADTPVTLTFRDTVGSTPATVTTTVKPRTITNLVVVTPSAGQSAACGTSVCAGGDAEIAVRLNQGGIALANRTVRFDVISGDVRIITSAAGSAEVLALSGSTVTDSTGTARMRVRVLADASSQTALMRVTDLGSGFTQTTSIPIAASSNAPLTVLPTSISFTGPDFNTCASGVSADIIVLGGRPPYQITQPSGFTVTPALVTNSGGHFTITANGVCAETGAFADTGGVLVAIVDANGANTSIRIFNNRAPVAGNAAPFAVAPTNVTLDSCNAVATVALIGGAGPGSYFSASGSSAVRVDIGTNAATIRRASGTTTTTSSIPVAFSDGKTVLNVTVNLSGAGLGACP